MDIWEIFFHGIPPTYHRRLLWKDLKAVMTYTTNTPLDETHLVAARGLTHQEVSTKVRQQGELVGAKLLRRSDI